MKTVQTRENNFSRENQRNFSHEHALIVHSAVEYLQIINKFCYNNSHFVYVNFIILFYLIFYYFIGQFNKKTFIMYIFMLVYIFKYTR